MMTSWKGDGIGDAEYGGIGTFDNGIVSVNARFKTFFDYNLLRQAIEDSERIQYALGRELLLKQISRIAPWQKEAKP